MSILSFLKGVLSLFISNFPEFVKRLFAKIPEGVKEQLATIIEVVNNLKGFVDSPLTDVLTSLIPGTVDDKVKAFLRSTLPVVLEELKLLKEGIITLSEDKEVRGAQLRAVSSVLTEKLTEMPSDQAAITSAVVYQNLK